MGPQPWSNPLKQALVLGGGSDIGYHVVRTLATSGVYDKVFWTYWNTHLHSLGQSIQMDITSEPSINALFDRIDTPGELGKIDLMVTAAFPFLECDNLNYEGYLKAEKFLRGHVLAMTK